MVSGLGYSIKVVARLTGLSSHVIRVWEKRYGAVRPDRTGTNRRLYSDAEVERLTLLRRATDAGHTISNVAKASLEELRKLVGDGEPPRLSVGPDFTPSPHAFSTAERVQAGLRAIRQLDSAALDRVLHQAAIELSQPALLQDLVAPLIQSVGELWEAGEMKIIHEHLASASLRTFMGTFVRHHPAPGYAPSLIVTTPTGQVHELGAMLAAVEASNHGWRVCYLGPSLPTEEIAAAALQQKARALALSVVYPADDPQLGRELVRLRQLLPDIVILVGGRAAGAYGPALQQIGAIECRTIGEFGAQLARHRTARSDSAL